MRPIEQVYNVTEQMLNVLNANNLERAEQIKKVNELIEKREEQLKLVVPPYTNEEIKIGKQIVNLNEQIKTKMHELYDRIKDDIVQFKQQKVQNRTYMNQYGSLETTDGMYLDQKK